MGKNKLFLIFVLIVATIVVVVILITNTGDKSKANGQSPAQSPADPKTGLANNNKTEPTERIPADWQTIDAEQFLISLPSGWNFNPLQGIDSYVGEFVGDGLTLNFDYGPYTNSSKNDLGYNNGFAIKEETIDGVNAEIVIPSSSNYGYSAFYPGSQSTGRSSLTISVQSEIMTDSQKDTILKIFRSVRFKTSPSN